MKPTPPPSENLFIRSYASWKQHSVKLTGKLISLAVLPIALLMLWVGILMVSDLQQGTARQANAIGDALAKQIAASVAEPLAANDQLSLNILLAQWRQNPLVAHTRLLTAENRVIAEAGDRSATRQLAPGQGRFNAAVHIQDTVAGQVQLSLSAEPFKSPVNALLNKLAWAALLLALVAGLVAWRMAANLRRTLRELALWDHETPAPGQQRRDEVGELARQLNQRFHPEPEPPEEEALLDSPEEDIDEDDALLASVIAAPANEASDHDLLPQDSAPADLDDAAAGINLDQLDQTELEDQTDEAAAHEPVTATEKAISAAAAESDVSEQQKEPEQAAPEVLESAVLAIRLGNQEALRRLPRARLMALLGRYREQLERACTLYSGHLHTLHDGTSLVVFNASECRQDELTHALCCGELLRVLGHDLQVEIADTGITLHLHLALCHTPSLLGFAAQEVHEHGACQTLIEQVQYSRNLLLLDSRLANCDALRQRAVVRRLASQPGIYCIERLQDPYQAMLEQQLNHLYQQRQS